MRILLLAGGSGGHIYPALAIAPELRKLDPEAELTFICSRKTLDISILRGSGEKYIPIFSGKLRRYFSFQNFTDVFLIAIGFVQSFFILLRLKPQVIFSKGGFVSVPALMAARVLRIPFIIHESDSVPGLANRIVSKGAAKILTAFPAKFGEWVGTPIRAAIREGDAEQGKKILGFKGDKPIVFVFAGSQGSKKLNDTVFEALETLVKKVDIAWVAGDTMLPQIDHPGVKVFAFLHEEFPHVLAAADLVVCRAGGSIFEVAAAGKPMILIPHPHTGGDHQRLNAEIFVEHGAAEMILDSALTADLLAEKIIDLLDQTNRRNKMAAAAKALFRPEAAERIAEAVIRCGTTIDK